MEVSSGGKQSFVSVVVLGGTRKGATILMGKWARESFVKARLGYKIGRK